MKNTQEFAKKLGLTDEQLDTVIGGNPNFNVATQAVGVKRDKGFINKPIFYQTKIL